MPEIFNPVDDLIAEQALVDALVADFTEDDWNRMASYCTTWTFKDVICHIAFFDYCAVELLAGRGESVNAVADAASEQDEHYHVMAFRDRSGADILNWWREQRTLMTASFLELRAVGGRHPAHVRAVARVGAPHGAVGAQRGPLRCARHRPCGEGTHHVHAVPFVAGPS